MTFVVGWTADDMALLASDLRRPLSNGEWADDFPKLVPLSPGWLAFSGNAAACLFLARRLTRCSPYELQAQLNAWRPSLKRLSTTLSEALRAHLEGPNGCVLWALVPAGTRFALWSFHPMKGTSERLDDGRVMALCPTGADTDYVGRVLSIYQDWNLGRGQLLARQEEIVSATRKVFADVAAHRGTASTSSAGAIIGIIGRDMTGQLLQIRREASCLAKAS